MANSLKEFIKNIFEKIFKWKKTPQISDGSTPPPKTTNGEERGKFVKEQQVDLAKMTPEQLQRKLFIDLGLTEFVSDKNPVCRDYVLQIPGVSDIKDVASFKEACETITKTQGSGTGNFVELSVNGILITFNKTPSSRTVTAARCFAHGNYSEESRTFDNKTGIEIKRTVENQTEDKTEDKKYKQKGTIIRDANNPSLATVTGSFASAVDSYTTSLIAGEFTKHDFATLDGPCFYNGRENSIFSCTSPIILSSVYPDMLQTPTTSVEDRISKSKYSANCELYVNPDKQTDLNLQNE